MSTLCIRKRKKFHPKGCLHKSAKDTKDLISYDVYQASQIQIQHLRNSRSGDIGSNSKIPIMDDEGTEQGMKPS